MAIAGRLPHSLPPGRVFRYGSFTTDPDGGLLTCRYWLDGREFTECVTLPPGPRWRTEAARAAARLVFLLAGVSYYKTAAPPVIELGDTAVTEAELAFLRDFYLQGLGEFAYRNALDLTSLRIEGRAWPPPMPRSGSGAGSGAGPGAVRRRDRLDRRGGAGAAARGRGAVHREPSG